MRKDNGAVTFAIIGLGGRGSVYLNALEEKFTGNYELVAIAEPDKSKKDYIKRKYGLSDDRIFDSDEEFLAQERLSDVAIVSTQDKHHKYEVMKLLERGYDIILEKPISTSLDEVMEIYEYAKQYPHTPVILGHLGGSSWLETMDLVKKIPNLYLDTSAYYSTFVLGIVINELPEKCIFGVDRPFGDLKLSKETILKVAKTSSTAEAVLGGNIARLLYI